MVSRGGLTVFCLSRHCACSKKFSLLLGIKNHLLTDLFVTLYFLLGALADFPSLL